MQDKKSNKNNDGAIFSHEEKLKVFYENVSEAIEECLARQFLRWYFTFKDESDIDRILQDIKMHDPKRYYNFVLLQYAKLRDIEDSVRTEVESRAIDLLWLE